MQPSSDNPLAPTRSVDLLVSATGQVIRRAVETPAQAADICRALIQENTERNQKNARIMALYNAEQPVDPARLREEGLGWKSNFSTKPLPVLIDKAASRFPKAVHAARYLTSARLPDSFPDAKAKSEKFQRRVTETVRANPRWKNFIAELAQENVMFGYAAATWLDEWSWLPSFFRQDAFFIPVGTKQNAASCNLLLLVKDYQVHEACEKLREAVEAGDERWSVANLAAAVNNAVPEKLRSNASDSARLYEDLLREVSLSTSFTGAEVVRFYNLFVVEPSGRVTHQIYDRNYALLFYHPERFEKMAHVSAFFAHQQADGTMHGSKGLGREVYNIARALDRSRNEVIDRLQLSGKLVIQGEERMLPRMKMHVVGNAVMIDSAFSVNQQKIDAGVEPFFTLDTYLTGLLDQIGGSTTPKQLQGDRVTAAQVDFMAGREDERADTFLERWLGQLMDTVTEIQRRLCLPGSSDADAKEFQRRMLEEEKLSPEELSLLGNSPAVGVVKDLTEVERASVLDVVTQARGNPQYDARVLEEQFVIAKVGADFAETVLLPVGDPTQIAEQSRLQMLETDLLLNGQQVPVSPRDGHLVHLETAAPAFAQAVQEAAKNPEADKILEVFLGHLAEHVELARRARVDPAALAPYEEAVKVGAAAVAELKKQAPLAPTAVEP